MNCVLYIRFSTELQIVETSLVAKLNIMCSLLKVWQISHADATIPKSFRAATNLTCYLEDDRIDSSGDPLSWWCDNQRRSPLLSKVASKCMCFLQLLHHRRVYSATGSIYTPLCSISICWFSSYQIRSWKPRYKY